MYGSLNSGITASSAQRFLKKILVYCLIIGIQEYIILFTQSLLATVCAYTQNDLGGKLFFQCVIRSVA